VTKRMEGRITLVTGSTSGIGRGIALVFAREGAKVVVTGRNIEGGQETVDMIKKEGGDAVFVQADLLQSSQVEKLINLRLQQCRYRGDQGPFY